MAFKGALAVITISCLLLLSFCEASSYSYNDYSNDRRLGEAPKFEVNTIKEGFASCYGSEYSYYKSWKCTKLNGAKCVSENEASTTGADAEPNQCPGTDPHDHSE